MSGWRLIKLDLTECAVRMIESADESPFRTFNSINNTSAEKFFSIIAEIERFIMRFEREIGMKSASKWIGERLNDAVSAGRTTVKSHLEHSYFSMYDASSRTSFILMENYEIVRIGFFRRRYDVYDLTVPRFILTRIVHEDTHAHLLSAEYANLYAELLQIARDEMERACVKMRIKKISPKISAPFYVREMEEKIAERMQRYAIDAFLSENCDEIEGYVMLGAPMFVMPDGSVMKCISDMLGDRKVLFRAGYVSGYQRRMQEYARSLRGVDEICVAARTYLHSRAEFLKDVVKRCLNGDHRLLNVRNLHW